MSHRAYLLIGLCLIIVRSQYVQRAVIAVAVRWDTIAYGRKSGKKNRNNYSRGKET